VSVVDVRRRRNCRRVQDELGVSVALRRRRRRLCRRLYHILQRKSFFLAFSFSFSVDITL